MKQEKPRYANNLKLRWKMLAVVLPLVILPICLVGSVVGYLAVEQATIGLTQTSKDDLDHMAGFAIDLLHSHHQQFQVYQQDKRNSFNKDLAALLGVARELAETEHRLVREGRISRETAQREARKALRDVSVGQSGYIYAINGQGMLEVHIAREGENILEQKDENGRFFIREMLDTAKASSDGEILSITYPWRNDVLGDEIPRKKVAAYLYFTPWDWVIAASGYLDETYEDTAFERKSFEELKDKIRAKKVGQTGYIFAMDSKGNFTVHPDAEGKNHIKARDSDGNAFLAEMCRNKTGWIRYPWKNTGETEARMKIVRYAYFAPWDWIVAVGSYEDEFYKEANTIKERTLVIMLGMVLLASLGSVVLVLMASKVLTDPIHHMIEVMRKVKQGRFDEKVRVESGDEIGELAVTFNRMTDMIRRNREMEANLALQGKMASLGVLSSGVAHEINNPLGVILGFAGYLESKLDPADPNYTYVAEIKRESKRCKKIVQDLLSYARTPKPVLEPTDINELLEQITDFASNHIDLHRVRIERDFAPALPQVRIDGDQIRQVAINLILNAGAATPEQEGEIRITTALEGKLVCFRIADNGSGIAEENLQRVFEPFFSTKEKGTGLGLAITRQIIEMHHGSIDIDSAPGRGTCIAVRLPLIREEF